MEIENQTIGNQELNADYEPIKNVSVVETVVMDQMQKNGFGETENQKLENEELCLDDKDVVGKQETIVVEEEQNSIEEKVILKVFDEPQLAIFLEQNEEQESPLIDNNHKNVESIKAEEEIVFNVDENLNKSRAAEELQTVKDNVDESSEKEEEQEEVDEQLQVCVEKQQNDEIKPKQIVIPEIKHNEKENEPTLENGLVIPPFVMEALEEIAVNEGFLPGYTFELQPGSSYGDGFVAIMVGVTIHGKKNKNFKIVDDKLVLLCKVPPTSQIRRKEFGSMLLFEREVFMYKELLPYFVKFQLEKGIKQHEGFFQFAKCYYASYDEAMEESVIILEDLRERGFTMCDKTKTASYFEIRKLMITLGRLHAISLALKDQQPTLFEKFKVTDKNDIFISDKLQPTLEMMCDQALTALGDHEEFKREKIQKLKPIISKTIANCITSPEAEPYAVVNHGDCWINNMMFSGESDSLHGEICMIDFQISRYASPVLDLVYFLLTCTDSETRVQHYDEFIQIYHKSLSDHLERLGGDAIRQFPMFALLNQLKKFGKFGICIAILMIPMLCTANSDLPDVEKITEDMFKDVKTMEPMINEKSSDNYKNRMSGVIRDAVRLGYL